MVTKKSVLITGCSKGGIGDALAREFHHKGLRVFATARNPVKIAHLKELGIETLSLDVTSAESIRTAAKEVSTATGGTLDFLVNNSGAGYSMPLMDVDIAEAKKLFDVNVFAIISVTQAFAPLLIEAKGTIVNNSSIVAFFPLPLQGMYNASKAAVGMMTDVMRIEMKPFDVKVVNLITGAVRTKFFENQPTVTLPSTTIYAPVKSRLEHVMTGAEITHKMDIDVFARRVVGDLLKTNPSTRVWRGGNTTLTWIFTFLPHTALDGQLSKLTGLSGLKQKTKTV
jgi:NAD(P)-dependent dehydrogenase (short-subunit alcohol dehydrogenase family)